MDFWFHSVCACVALFHSTELIKHCWNCSRVELFCTVFALNRTSQTVAILAKVNTTFLRKDCTAGLLHLIACLHIAHWRLHS